MNKSKEKLIPIIWVAFLMSVIAYIAILFGKHGGFSQFEHLDYDRMFLFEDPLGLSLYILTVLGLGAYFVIPNFIISTSPEKKALTGFILRLALLECICLYGFVFGMVQKDIQVALPFFLVSFVGIFIMNPLTKLEDIKPSNPTTMT